MLSVSTILRAIAVALFIGGNVALAAPTDNVNNRDVNGVATAVKTNNLYVLFQI